MAVCVPLVAQPCPTLCDPLGCSPPAFSVHEILQARILEWVAISFSRETSRPRDRTRVFYTAADSVLMELPWDCILLQLFILDHKVLTLELMSRDLYLPLTQRASCSVDGMQRYL